VLHDRGVQEVLALEKRIAVAHREGLL
jgi:hypothetical protein